MTTPTQLPEQPGGINIPDLLFVFFRQKWKIALCTTLGLALAAGIRFFTPPSYESVATVMVRYILEKSAIDDMSGNVEKPGGRDSTVLNSEVQILMSRDLAVQTAEALLPESAPIAGGSPGADALAGEILSGLTACPIPKSNIIYISMVNEDPEFVTPALEEMLTQYLDKHLEIHRSLNAFGFVSQQAEQVRSRLNETDQELKLLKSDAGIVSLQQRRESLEDAMQKTHGELFAVETEMAEQSARVTQVEQLVARKRQDSPTSKGNSSADGSIVREYRALVGWLDRLRQRDLDLLSRFTPESQSVKLNRRQIENLEEQRRFLEEKFPSLTSAAIMSDAQIDPVTEKARLAAIKSKKAMFNEKLERLLNDAKNLAEISPRIEQLERRKEVDDNNYKYLLASLEKARIDEALDPTRIPNISIVQRPTPARRVAGALNKVVLACAFGGLGLGLALALVIEYLIDRRVKRPVEIDVRLGIPLIYTIPHITESPRNRRRLRGRDLPALPGSPRLPAKKAGAPSRESWEEGHFIRPFAEAIRDRLILYFELNRLTHKPKLVAVTSNSGGAGASTVAASLASVFSETGDGKVLHVDMTMRHPTIHPFFEGKRSVSLSEALETGNEIELEPARENLYLATARQNGNGRHGHLVPKRFYDLLPRLKASEFDYIIFDMPTLEESSVTLAIAGFMDKVLLVTEAEKNTRDELKRNYHELVAAKAKVACILNKARTYGPRWLQSSA